MPLTGNTLAAYNNLPGFPPEPKLGNLLNALNVPNPAYVGLTTPIHIELFVATTGNDTTGAGTQALPYATVDRAIADFLNAELPRFSSVKIFLGAGDFEWPILAKYCPTNILVTVYGDVSQPLVDDVPATSASLVAGYFGLWTVPVGAYGGVVGAGTHWMRLKYNASSPQSFSDLALPCAPSTSPNIRFPCNFADATSYDQFSIYPYASRFYDFRGVFEGNTPYVAADPAYGAESDPSLGAFGFKVLGVELLHDGGNYVNCNLQACKFDDAGSSFTSSVASSNIGGYIAPSTYVLMRNALLTNTYSEAGPGEITIRDGSLSGVVHAGLGGAFLPEGNTALFDVDFRTTGAAAAIRPQSCCHLFLARVSVAGALFIDTRGEANCAIVAGPGTTISGVVTSAFAIRLTNGSQGVALEAACAGNLTNSGTPGAEIVVGGNAAVAFSALPTNDIAAGTPQLCRAT